MSLNVSRFTIVLGSFLAPLCVLQADVIKGVIPVAHIRGQTYCYGDADVFTVSLALDIEITNKSLVAIYVNELNLIPYVGRLAATLQDAQSGKYLFELTGTHIYPSNYVFRNRVVRVKPGESITIPSGYDILARYKTEARIGNTVSSGT